MQPLKTQRMQEGYKQNEFASSVGLSERGYRKIENGEVIPNVYTAIRIASKLNKSVEELFSEPNDQPHSTLKSS